jgi:glutamate/tyrosine decarboxylase-like PLP-dependent enzyme
MTPLDLAAQRAQEYLSRVAGRHVAATATSAELIAELGGPLPAAGVAPEEIVDRLARAAERGTVATQGPRYFGFVVGGSLPAATAADWLVSTWDQNAGIYLLSPMVSVIEDVAGAWLRDLATLPADWSTGFVTGCQMANFTALATARHHVLAAAGWDVASRGLYGAPEIHVVVSDESHYTIFNALRYLGLGADRVTRVPTDDQGRMRAELLPEALARRTGPCIVCAQAGNVNTGAFDPIAPIADATRARGAWLHVDGAFGLWAAATPGRASLVAGIDRADSVASDGHKWLNVPYDCGLVFCAHPASHRAAMTTSSAYVIATETERDPRDFVPEESRRARSVPVYAALLSLGGDGLGALVERCCQLASRMAERLSQDSRLRVLNDVVLNQVLVRVAGSDDDDADARTREMIARLQADGTCWASGTTWHGMAALRISVSNWSTTAADIDASADAIRRAVP